MKGCKWKVGNDHDAKFWSDPWLLSGHTLKDVALLPVPLEDLEIPVSHYLEAGRGWKSYLFANILPCRFFNEVILYKASFNDTSTADEVKWTKNPSGYFSTKSAYELIADIQTQRQDEGLWKMVWKIKGPQTIRVFLWKLLNNGVFTNVLRVQHLMGSSKICPLCQSSAEELILLFRDCSAISNFWKAALKADKDTIISSLWIGPCV